MKNTMIKALMGLFIVVALSGCGTFHDGGGWEHNMDEQSESILEHKH